MAGMARDVWFVVASTVVQARVDIRQVITAGNWTRLYTLKRFYFKAQSLSAMLTFWKVTD